MDKPTEANLTAPEIIKVEDSIDTIYKEYYENGWTDGLPIIPPTKERVARMMSAVDRPPDDIVAQLPPRVADVTIEKIAINAVMAGCLPPYMPVIVAAVEAIADPEFNLKGHASTTSPTAIMLVINGPVRQKLDINSSWGVFGPGWRANATIGRAISLIMLNIGGQIPREICKATLAAPGRYTMCIGENEEDSPWEPLHVDRGFRSNESTVTVVAADGYHPWEYFTTDIRMLDAITCQLHTPFVHVILPVFGQPEYFLIIGPSFAKIFANEGYSKEDVLQYLYDHTQDIPASIFPDFIYQDLINADRQTHGFLTSRKALIESGKVKPDQKQVSSKGVALLARPDQICIVVSGANTTGSGGAIIPAWFDGRSITRRIKQDG
jgi:hypothetical protein